MADADARVFSIPPGWPPASSSKKGMQLLPAEVFNRSASPAKDESLHVALLRRPPIPLVIALGVISVLLVWVVVSVLAQAGTTPSMQGPMPYIVAVFFGLVGLFFAASFVNSIAAIRSRGSWGNRQGIALGRSGIALRLQGFAVDIPWDEVTAVRAMYTNDGTGRSRRAHIPVLRVERGREHWDLGCSVLGSSPALVYTVLHWYWTHPGPTRRARHHLRPAADGRGGRAHPADDRHRGRGLLEVGRAQGARACAFPPSPSPLPVEWGERTLSTHASRGRHPSRGHDTPHPRVGSRRVVTPRRKQRYCGCVGMSAACAILCLRDSSQTRLHTNSSPEPGRIPICPEQST